MIINGIDNIECLKLYLCGVGVHVVVDSRGEYGKIRNFCLETCKNDEE